MVKYKLVISSEENDLIMDLKLKKGISDVKISKMLKNFSRLVKCKKCGKRLMLWTIREGDLCLDCLDEKEKKQNGKEK